MGLSNALFLVLSALLIDTGYSSVSAPFCQCPCENRISISKDWFNCITIYSMKTKGYVTADEHYPFLQYYERYVFATNQNKLWGTAKWKVEYKEGNNGTYGLKNLYVKEWLHAGRNDQARDSFRRYLLTKIRGDPNIPPRDGYWQFIPDPKIGKDVYRIRNTFTGEYLFVDDEQHIQRYDYNRLYLWRLTGNYQSTDNRHWFKLAKCK
ncbi:hypothetical protein RP20_CCG014525 [Aedes albopictus]|uniref:Putative secreted protein n=1 Tax=Aedes albopictus TaxID=7160 RepID=A0A023EJI3_AEDAL|nr:hypothetical protein RP20_CCG014525 [Aedes albopictus]